jgi:hypothetical protein
MSERVFFRRGEEVLRVALEHQRLVLGRAENNDIVIPDPQERHVRGLGAPVRGGAPPAHRTARGLVELIQRLAPSPALMTLLGMVSPFTRLEDL